MLIAFFRVLTEIENFATRRDLCYLFSAPFVTGTGSMKGITNIRIAMTSAKTWFCVMPAHGTVVYSKTQAEQAHRDCTY